MRHHCLTALASLTSLAAALAADPTPAPATPAAKGAPNAEKLGWRVAVQSYSFNRFTFFEAVDKTASIGLRHIEGYPGQKLSAELGDATLSPGLSPELQQKVKDKLTQAGVKLVNYGVVGLPNNEAQSRAVFEFAKAMGIETLCSEPGADALDLVDKLATEYGINVAFHNHPTPSRYANPDTVLEACKGRSARLGACADTGHWMRSDIQPLEALRKLSGHIISFHFKDLNQFGKGAHDVHWGTGQANVKALLAEIKKQGIKAVFSIEYEYNWDNSVPDMAACVEYFEQVATELAAQP